MNSIKKNYVDLVIFFYFFVFFVIGLITAKDYGIHIEEKFHRSNGFYWLNYLLSFLLTLLWAGYFLLKNLPPIIFKPSSVTFALPINSSLPKSSLWYKDKFSAVPVQLP